MPICTVLSKIKNKACTYMLYRVQTVYSIFVESEKTELHCPCRSLVQKKICKNPKQTAGDLDNEYM